MKISQKLMCLKQKCVENKLSIITGALATIVFIGSFFLRANSSSLKGKITPLDLQKQLLSKTRIASLQPFTNNSLGLPPSGKSFIMQPYTISEFQTGRSYGFMYSGSGVDMIYTTGGAHAGRVVVRFPDGSSCVMDGGFFKVDGGLEYYSNTYNQPLSIRIEGDRIIIKVR